MSRFTNDIDMIGELLNNTVIQLILVQSVLLEQPLS